MLGVGGEGFNQKSLLFKWIFASRLFGFWVVLVSDSSRMYFNIGNEQYALNLKKIDGSVSDC